MLGGRYCTPIVERQKPHYLYHINGIGRNRPGSKLDADSQLSFFSPHWTPNRSTGKGQIGPLSFIYSTGVSSVSIFYAASVTTRAEARKVRSADGARERSRAPQKTEMETLAARPSSSICQRAVQDSARCDGAGDRGAPLIGQAGEARTYRLESLPSSQSRRTS